MLEINPTPQKTALLYAEMSSAIETMRKRLGRPLTLSEKLLFGHLVRPDSQQLAPGEVELDLWPDRVVLQDVLGQTAWLQFAQTGLREVAIPTSVHCDHLISARHGARSDLEGSLREDDEVYSFLRSAAARYGAAFWEPGSGIIHQIVLENYAIPGALVLGTDSHTPNAGGLCALAVGVGGAEAVEAMAGRPWSVLHPKRIAVWLTGSLGGWASPKDLALTVAGLLTTSGGTDAVIEYIGPGARSLSATGRATVTNLGAEVGATTSLLPADDEAVPRYLAATGRAEIASLVRSYRHLFAPDPEAEASPERFYDRVLRIDLSRIEPVISGPHRPDRAVPLSAFVAEMAASGADALSVALVGSCTNSSYEDLDRAASVARAGLRAGLRARSGLLVTPGTERVRSTAARDGLLGALEAIGAQTLASACGPCIGRWERADPDGGPSNIATTYNRNFPGRNDGRPETRAFLMSPELAVAFALAGRLSFDPRKDTLLTEDGRRISLPEPSPRRDLPQEGFSEGDARCRLPDPADRDRPLAIRQDSERLAPLPRLLPWDGRDLLEMPVLMKVESPTTTDQISPAGRWLRYRGHLERFSENFLSGARCAYTGERGRTLDTVRGERAPVAAVARGYRDRGLRSVIVGGENYGEGSSREHAALSARLLGVAAVIARSFARIHRQNLRKQGILALTFADPGDYDRVGPRDRVSLVNLRDLAEGIPLRARLTREDGSVTEITLVHGCTNAQLGWFYAGSALGSAEQVHRREVR